MATKTGTTALSTAMKGGKVTERQAQSALGSAVTKIANLTKKANESKEAMLETGTLVLHTAETQGSLFLSSMAEGFFGEDKLKVGAVDVRAPVGLLAQGYGLYQTMSGQRGAGAHVLALGNGVMGSWLANVARNAGKTLAEKRAGGQAGAPAPAPTATVTPTTPTIVMQGHPALPGPSLFPEPMVTGPMREVLLTPAEPVAEGDGEELGRRGRGPRGGRGGGRRFPGRGGEDDET
jgi:hypothetical protein